MTPTDFQPHPTAAQRLGRSLRAQPLPGRTDVVYAVSTRRDGTMSSSVGAGDHVAARRRLAAAVGAGSAAFMRQVHGAAVARIDELEGPTPEADAIVTTQADLPLAVLVADCVPVVLAAGDAVAAVHAGRLGVEREVIAATVSAVTEAGASASESHAVIGPAIGPCCYEVPADMAAALDRRWPGAAGSTTWGTPSLDLPGTVTAQLRAAGVGKVTAAGECTRCGADTYFSHRASTGPDRLPPGRQAMVVMRTSALPVHLQAQPSPDGEQDVVRP